MPWPPNAPPRGDFSGDEGAAYDRALERYRATPHWSTNDDTIPGYYGSLMVSPIVGGFYNVGGVMFRRSELRDGIPHKWREFTDLVVSESIEPRWNFAFLGHVGDAVAHGVRPQAIAAVREHRWDDLFPEERQVADYAREVLTGTVSDESFDGVCQFFGERGAVEFTAFVCWLMMTRRIMGALGFVDPEDDELDARIKGFVDGTAEIPNPTANIPASTLGMP
jgi:hypothetical protein